MSIMLSVRFVTVREVLGRLVKQIYISCCSSVSSLSVVGPKEHSAALQNDHRPTYHHSTNHPKPPLSPQLR